MRCIFIQTKYGEKSWTSQKVFKPKYIYLYLIYIYIDIYIFTTIDIITGAAHEM